MKGISAVITGLAATLVAGTLHAQVGQTRSETSPLPRLVERDGRFALFVDDAPFLVLVSQLNVDEKVKQRYRLPSQDRVCIAFATKSNKQAAEQAEGFRVQLPSDDGGIWRWPNCTCAADYRSCV